ncbi:MAG TPA: hypothetical protein VHO07_10790, partial [Streptosporangiaceae bacterium]|nr:hypothetical protein [Streptosporangiaceae bacterium]
MAPVRKTKKTLKASQAAKTVTKIVRYDGFEVSVPAGWPVYWLNQDPGQCVRYDTNAVYVGTPSAKQNCPAGLMGRADTISIGGPADAAGPAAPSAGQTSAEADQRAVVDGQPASEPTVASGTIMQNPDLHEFAVSMPASSPQIDATYGSDPDLIEHTLDTIRQSAPIGAQNAFKVSSSVEVMNSASANDPVPTGDDWAWGYPAPGTPAPTPSPTPKPTP